MWPIGPFLPSLAHILAAGDKEQTDGYQKKGMASQKVSGEVSLAFAAFIPCRIQVAFEAFVMEVKLTAAVISQPQTFQRRLWALQVRLFSLSPL